MFSRRGNSRGRGSFGYRGNRGRGGGWRNYQRFTDNDGMSYAKITTDAFGFDIPDGLNGPYAGWKIYFPAEEYRPGSSLLNKVIAAEKYISCNNSSLFQKEDVLELETIVLDLKSLESDTDLKRNWPALAEDILQDTHRSLNCFALATYRFIWNPTNAPCENFPILRARLSNHDVITPIQNLSYSDCGKLASICGTVVKLNNPGLKCSYMAFTCVVCNGMQCVQQPDGVFTQPKRCATKGCSHRSFKPLRNSKFTKVQDVQIIILQEMTGGIQRTSGDRDVPQRVECELTDDLIGACIPGDIVTLTGVVKICPLGEETNKKIRKSASPATTSFLSLCLEAVGVKTKTTGSTPEEGRSLEFTDKDYIFIQEVESEPNLFKLLVRSLCPAIYGHEMVKAGLLLALFSGCKNEREGNRSNSHVLVVGDPGLGKSQMLKACTFVSPKGIYVCGNVCTNSGLTATLMKEGLNDYSLEAGALLLSHNGCCCIDEFDKMQAQQQSVLEVMEQQTISIAKCGVICTLEARATVLAAANPVGGCYDGGKTVAENLKLEQPLLSRFDLIFILKDKPDEEFDSLVSEHISKHHLSPDAAVNWNCGNVSSSLSNETEGKNSSNPTSLHEKLKCSSPQDLLPAYLLRKYIAYAHNHVLKQRLSREAKEALVNFYLEMRKRAFTPVTLRKLLSLLRLTRARAKAELREEATVTDAMEVIELMRWSLKDADEGSFLPPPQGRMGGRSSAKKFWTILQRDSKILQKACYTMGEMREMAARVGISSAEVTKFVENFTLNGLLCNVIGDNYKILIKD